MPYYTRYNIQCSRGTAVTWGTMYPYPTYWTEVSSCDDSELSHYLTYGADRGRPTHPSSIIPLPEWQACSQWEKQNNLTGVLGWCGRIIIEVRNLPREERKQCYSWLCGQVEATHTQNGRFPQKAVSDRGGDRNGMFWNLGSHITILEMWLVSRHNNSTRSYHNDTNPSHLDHFVSNRRVMKFSHL